MSEYRHSAQGIIPKAWPLIEHSFLTIAANLRWHVQQMGEGPDIVLIHGTGAATHSWAGLMPILAQNHRVTAMDLPGHGFTRKPGTERLSLPAMSEAIAGLLDHLEIRPKAMIGHSAGAAIMTHLTMEGLASPQCLISINGAYRPFQGVQGKTYGRIARSLVLNPVVPYLAAFRFKTSKMVEKMLDQTGSRISQAGADAYRLAVQRPSHIASALGMMSQWDLHPLWSRIGGLNCPLLLITGSNDRTIPPEVSIELEKRIASATHIQLDGLGHLAHEEDPQRVAEVISSYLA